MPRNVIDFCSYTSKNPSIQNFQSKSGDNDLSHYSWDCDHLWIYEEEQNFSAKPRFFAFLRNAKWVSVRREGSHRLGGRQGAVELRYWSHREHRWCWWKNRVCCCSPIHHHYLHFTHRGNSGKNWRAGYQPRQSLFWETINITFSREILVNVVVSIKSLDKSNSSWHVRPKSSGLTCYCFLSPSVSFVFLFPLCQASTSPHKLGQHSDMSDRAPLVCKKTFSGSSASLQRREESRQH